MSKNVPGADTLDGFIISEALTFALDKSVIHRSMALATLMTHHNTAIPNMLDILLKVAYFFLLSHIFTSTQSCICDF